MRSLTTLRLDRISLGDFVPAGKVTAVVVDPETHAGFAGVERTDGHGVEVDLLRLTKGETSQWDVEPITTFSSPVSAPFELPEQAHEIISLRFFADTQSICIILAGGDINTLQLAGPDGEPSPVDVVGSIESGIKAAAWSPDEEQLVLVTGEDKVMCMSRIFDVIYEEPLRTDDFGAEQPINVGWGSKTTQFHGSLGKAAAQAAAATPASSAIPPSLAHTTDDSLPRITFRGDAAYFSISSLDPYSAAPAYSRRQIRVYSRDPIPKLTATSEVLPGLEPAVAWRPSGNLIAGVVRYGYEGGGDGREGRWDVAMLERNGLRHGGFELREDSADTQRGRIREMAWNCDSELLAVWVERVEGHVVQLWSMKNYHYYLKQEIHPHGLSKRFNAVYWHPENPLQLYVAGDDYVETRQWVWETFSSRLPMPLDTASVAVVDGKKLLITPFRTQNVPPPMSSYHLDLPRNPIHVAFSLHEDVVAVLFENKVVQIWDLETRIPVGGSGSRLRGGGKAAEPKLRSEVSLEAPGRALQVVLGKDGVFGVLVQTDGVDGKESSVFTQAKGGDFEQHPTEGPVERLLDLGDDLAWLEAGTGDVYKVGSTDPALHLQDAPSVIQVSLAHDLVFSLTPNSQLLANSTSSAEFETYKVANAVTSFTVTPDFLIYTTSAHTSFYASLTVLKKVVEGQAVSAAALEWESRRVERGSLIVVACPSTMSLVLQMPRGNLETIYPRAMVLAVVRQDVLNAQYRTALITCRKHRIDLNLLYDLDPEGIISKLDLFVTQVHEVDHLNLFISALSEDDVSPQAYRDLDKLSSASSSKSKINTICDALRARLEARDMVKYIETIMTAHVCKSPPDYESALAVLLKLQVSHPEIVEDSVKYIIFLSDVNKLYDVALGMYNFQLVLLVAQYSQKDPKEYLPFLRELRALDKYEQQFRIDDHLERHSKALRSLYAAGPSQFDRVSSYVNNHDLYLDALTLCKDEPEHLAVIYNLYGDHLYDQRDFRDAALAYQLAVQPKKAIKAYEKAHAWRELFALAITEKLDAADLDQMCSRVGDHLASRGRPLEASRVYLEHSNDVDAAVDVLCRGMSFSEAQRVIAKHNRLDLIEETFYPNLEESVEQYTELFEEMNGQLDKELHRLGELRTVKSEDPDTFYMIDTEPALDNVDVATNATTVATAFTRYTVAPTTVFSQTTRATGMTGMTGMTSKSKKKPKRRAAGRKGTVDEYEYLLASIGRLVTRVDDKTDEVEPIFPHLLMAPEELRESGHDLQRTVKALRSKLVSSIEAAWLDRESMMEGVGDGAGGGLVEVVRPTVKEWRGLSFFD